MRNAQDMSACQCAMWQGLARSNLHCCDKVIWEGVGRSHNKCRLHDVALLKKLLLILKAGQHRLHVITNQSVNGFEVLSQWIQNSLELRTVLDLRCCLLSY